MSYFHPPTMFTYTVDLPAANAESDSYRNWQDKEVASLVLAYNFTNPLGISPFVNTLVVVYFPVLILCAGVMNTFALCVLQSNFLRYLVIQPMLRALLYIQILLLLVGPFYVWLVQHCGLYLYKYQLYPCFLIVWGHNSAVLATSNILVAMIVERATSIGRPELLWGISRTACRNITNVLLVISLIFGAGGLMYVDGSVDDNRSVYPICLPWWNNEHPLVPSLWYKLLAFSFTLLPSFLITLSMMLLVSSVSGFKHKIRSSTSALNHYNAMYLEIRSTLHLKFVKAVCWLGSLFVCSSTSLGCFIIFGPAFYYRASIRDTGPYNSSTKLPTYSLFHFLDNSYLLASRSDTETLVWIMYYTFTLCVVPVLLAKEVLFRREWRGQLKTILNCRPCLRNHGTRLLSCDINEFDEANLVGPYIAKSAGRQSPRSLWKVECIKIYDAGKAERAGRKVDMATFQS